MHIRYESATRALFGPCGRRLRKSSISAPGTARCDAGPVARNLRVLAQEIGGQRLHRPHLIGAEREWPECLPLLVMPAHAYSRIAERDDVARARGPPRSPGRLGAPCLRMLGSRVTT
jgi:hypothetical protein